MNNDRSILKYLNRDRGNVFNVVRANVKNVDFVDNEELRERSSILFEIKILTPVISRISAAPKRQKFKPKDKVFKL